MSYKYTAMSSILFLLAITVSAAGMTSRPLPSAPLFGAAVAYGSGGQNGSAVAVGDVNGDGKPDLLVTNDCYSSDNCTDPSVGVLLGNGDGTFQAAVSYGTGGYHASAIAVADVNGDGKLDLVIAQCSNASSCNGAVGVLLGNGDGTFQTAVNYSTGGYVATSVAVADVNGDGKPDVLVANQCVSVNSCANGSVGVLLNNGNGTYRTATTYSSGGQYAQSVEAADVNGDHKYDLVVAHQCAAVGNCANGVVGVLLGNGDGTFQTVKTYSTGGQYSYAAAVADVNGDGKPDLLATNRCSSNGCTGDGTVAVLLGNGSGTFRAAVAYDSGGSSPYSVTVADVNGDSKPDLLVANSCANSTCYNGSVGALLGNGDGTFQAALTYNTGGYGADSIVAQDVDGDGNPDLLVANLCASFNDCTDGVVGVLLGAQSGTTTVLTTSVSPSYINQPVTFTATIATGGGQIPNGETVTFDNGSGSPIGTGLTINGVAKYTTSALPLGTQFIKAIYPGDAYFQPSSGAVQQQVIQYTTTTALVSSPNPSFYGQSVQLTATVKSAAPGGATGTVTFEKGTQVLGSGNLSGGKATFTVTNFQAGTFTLAAIYNGDAQSAKSSGTTSQTVKQAATATSLTSTPNPSNSGQLVKFTATVTSTTTTPTGTVSFMDGSKTLATTYLTQGVTTYATSTLSTGTHSITAVYNGTPNIAGSKSAVLMQTVQ